MAVETFLGRLVVVRYDRQGVVGARFPGIGGKLDRLGGGVRAGAGNDGDALCGVVHRGLDQQPVLVPVHRRRFTGGADHDDAVGAFLDMPVDQPAECVKVERAILLHGSDDCDQAALQRRHFQNFP